MQNALRFYLGAAYYDENDKIDDKPVPAAMVALGHCYEHADQYGMAVNLMEAQKW